MNKATISALLVAAFALGCVAAPLVVLPVRAGTSPTRWEYKCVSAWGDIEQSANQLGAQGWELGGVGAAGSADPRWCFKRALPQ